MKKINLIKVIRNELVHYPALLIPIICIILFFVMMYGFVEAIIEGLFMGRK